MEPKPGPLSPKSLPLPILPPSFLLTLNRSAPQLWPLLLADIHLFLLGWSLLMPPLDFSGYPYPLYPPSQLHKNHLPPCRNYCELFETEAISYFLGSFNSQRSM